MSSVTQIEAKWQQFLGAVWVSYWKNVISLKFSITATKTKPHSLEG
jgi:hypothetical protein